jgi:hypothetical protein
MKWVEFTMLNIEVVGPKQVRVQAIDGVLVDVDKICAIIPHLVPGELKGPTGESMAHEGSQLLFGGGGILVDASVEEVFGKIGHPICYAGPPNNDGPESKQHIIKLGDN